MPFITRCGVWCIDVAGGAPEDVLADLVDFFLPFLVDFAFLEGAVGCAGAACVAASPAAAELAYAPDVPGTSLGYGAGG